MQGPGKKLASSLWLCAIQRGESSVACMGLGDQVS